MRSLKFSLIVLTLASVVADSIFSSVSFSKHRCYRSVLRGRIYSAKQSTGFFVFAAAIGLSGSLIYLVFAFKDKIRITSTGIQEAQ
ncbi:hypothetical protein C9J21_13270 [Photobacterium phosphoreum]|nr:hypothetical protein C9J22_04965 [Photobacterium phosphoreum]PSW32100.1 hypothetical protein C9J21_13270 [Photobacterium phosphoreum]